VVKGKKLFVLILDAFSDRYLKYAYYLDRLRNENYYSTIKPLFAYEGIRTAILTGLDPYKSGIWHDKIFIPEGRKDLKLNFLKFLTAFFDKLSPTDDINKGFRFLLFKLFKEDYGTPHLIPTEYLQYFATYNHKCRIIPDLFQVLGRNGIRVTWVEPKLMLSEENTLRGILKLFEKHDLVIVKLNSLDRLGHRFGPLSNEIRKRVEYLDGVIEETITTLQVRLENMSFIIMSDHGMVPVEKTINIEKIMTKETSIRPLIDYIPYIGSTFASFFVFNRKTEDIIYEALQGLSDYGRILEEQELLTFGINKELYGHIIFALNEKNVFFPDFFRRRNIPKGMHGYASASYDRPIFVTNITLYDRCKKSEIEFSKLHWLILMEFLATE